MTLFWTLVTSYDRLFEKKKVIRVQWEYFAKRVLAVRVREVLSSVRGKLKVRYAT